MPFASFDYSFAIISTPLMIIFRANHYSRALPNSFKGNLAGRMAWDACPLPAPAIIIMIWEEEEN
jgi:hypothetical protein